MPPSHPELPAALFALGFAWFTAAVLAGEQARLLAAGAVPAGPAVGTWLPQVEYAELYRIQEAGYR